MPRTIVLPASVDEVDFALINDWQRGFPLAGQPFARVGAAHQLDAAEVLDRYRRLLDRGVVSRIGPVFAPNSLGASALVALAVPPAELEAVAARVNAEPTVNHNYEREHRYNLWFVITAADRAELEGIVGRISAETACPNLILPLEEEFHIDLGFDLAAAPATRRPRDGAQPLSFTVHERPPLASMERKLARALQRGLELVERPYAQLARQLDCSETEILSTIARWLDNGLVRRFGVVVRHHELGLAANAMCVWDVDDDKVSALGRELAREPAVTLCYRRRRVLPDWPYNLFCMIHGHEREQVLAARADISKRLGLEKLPQAVLFSGRRFKQRGARYLADEETADV